MIRQLHANDAAAYRRLRLQALQSDPDAYCAAYAEESRKPELFMEGCLLRNDPENIVFGYFEEAELKAIAAFVKSQAELIQIYTDPACRGRGIGKALLKAVIRAAFDFFSEIDELHIRVILTERHAAGLYRIVGFEPCITIANILYLNLKRKKLSGRSS